MTKPKVVISHTIRCLLLLTALCAACGSLNAVEPIRIGLEQELFVDDHLVADLQGLKRTVHQPQDIADNPVIVSERPWEHRRIPFGSVLWIPDEKKFKCWYLVLNIYDSRPGFRGYRAEHQIPIHEAAYICYAESADGIHWTKPDLGLHAYRGSKRNNIVLVSPGTHFDSTSVMYLPHDKQWPYRLMTFIGRWPYDEQRVKQTWGDPPPFGIQRHGHYAFGSKDGIHWHELNGNAPVLEVSDRSMFWWDPDKQIFAGAAKRSLAGKRAQAYAWSPDMINWTVTSDWIHKVDHRDHPQDEGEAAYGFPYGSQWLGFAEMRRVRRGQRGIVDSGTKINWELLTSRDGRAWSRPFRNLFYADGAKKTWRYQVFKIFANPPILRDGKLMIYYGGKTGTVPVETGTRPFQALCLATLRRDGFVSLTAGESSGTLITKPLLWSGDRLRMNYVARPGGSIAVEARTTDGTPIRGFEFEHFRELTGDELDGEVRWSGHADVSQLAGRAVQLRIRLKKADLFSIQVTKR